MARGLQTSIEDRALVLLGAGVQAESVAAALGVTPGRISQLLSNSEFASRVNELKFHNLSEQNEIDGKYRSMESTLQEKLGELIPYMMKPGEILAALRTVNSSVRRGAAPDSNPHHAQRDAVTLNIPIAITQQFVTNIHNQVIRAGEQDLVTVQSSRMKDLLSQNRATADTLVISNETHGSTQHGTHAESS